MRSPQAPLLVPNADLRDYTEKVHKVWNVWWRLWQDHYVEQLFEQSKWFDEGEPVQIGDLVMFRRQSTDFGQHFKMGRVDEISPSHDGRVRSVWIKYRIASENNSRRVERDVLTIFKLLGVEDTSLHASLEAALRLAEAARSRQEVPPNPSQNKQEKPKKKVSFDIPESDQPVQSDHSKDDDVPNASEEVKMRRKRRSELELLKDWSVQLARENSPRDFLSKRDFVSLLMPHRGLDAHVKYCCERKSPLSQDNKQ